jgi:NIPSNAP
MAEAVKLYAEFGYPAPQKGGQDKKLIGYFQADTGMVNQLVHLWKFDDNTDPTGLRYSPRRTSSRAWQ